MLPPLPEGAWLPAVPGSEGLLVVSAGGGLLAAFEDCGFSEACEGACAGTGAGAGSSVGRGLEGMSVAGEVAGFATLLGQH